VLKQSSDLPGAYQFAKRILNESKQVTLSISNAKISKRTLGCNAAYVIVHGVASFMTSQRK